MNNFLIVYENANYVLTAMNASLKETQNYYVGNHFTFGSNEEKFQAVAVFEYDEFKEKVLNYNMNNNNVTVNFDDENKEMTFKTQYNDFVTVSYEQVETAIYKFEKATHSDYINIMIKVANETKHVFENELYLRDAYQDSILAYSKDFREEETNEPYHVWLENHISHMVMEGY